MNISEVQSAMCGVWERMCVSSGLGGGGSIKLVYDQYYNHSNGQPPIISQSQLSQSSHQQGLVGIDARYQ